jgi:hypothetical protein
MIWNRKSTSFIDNSMIIPFTTKAGYFSMNLGRANWECNGNSHKRYAITWGKEGM